MLFGGGGAKVEFDVVTVTDTRATPVTATGSIRFNADGTITYVGNGSAGSTNWFTPTTAGIGAGYWARLVVNSGTAPTGSAVNTLISLTLAPLWQWVSTANQVKTGSMTVSIYADAAGTILVASDTFFISVEST